MLKKLLATTAGSLLLAAATTVGASAADGATAAFLCYSHAQVDPGAYSLVSPTPEASQAQSLLEQGYWSPYAEKSVPTNTMITGGYYLDCQLPLGLTATGQVVGLAGIVHPANGLSGQAGLYPLATTAFPAWPLPIVALAPTTFPIPAEQ